MKSRAPLLLLAGAVLWNSLVFTPSVDGQLFSMLLNEGDIGARYRDPSTGVFRESENDDVETPKRKKLYVFTKSELAEISGQDIDFADEDEFYERDDAHIITLGANSSRIVNKENISWELIKLLRTKVMTETEAWMNMKLAEETILQKFKGKQKSLAKIVLKNIWGRKKASHVRQIKNMLDVIQELYVRLISNSTGSSASSSNWSSTAGQAMSVTRLPANNEGIPGSSYSPQAARPIHFPGDGVKKPSSSSPPSLASTVHFPDVQVQHNNRRKPSGPSSASNGNRQGVTVPIVTVHGGKEHSFPDAINHFADVLPSVTSGKSFLSNNNQQQSVPSGALVMGPGQNSLGGAAGGGQSASNAAKGQQAASSKMSTSGGEKGSPSVPSNAGKQGAAMAPAEPEPQAGPAQQAVEPTRDRTPQPQPESAAAVVPAPPTAIMPSTTSEILKLLLVDFNRLQQQTPAEAKAPAKAPEPGVEWTYDEGDDAGPPRWGRFYPSCAGERQSPVDLILEETEEFEFDDLVFTNLDAPRQNVSIQHNGHTVKMLLKGPTKILCNGGGLGTEYVLRQIHFHWGSRIFRGSEHQLERRRFPAEMHMVFMKQDYSAEEEALLHDDGLAVMGFFVNVQPRDNRELDEFFKSLELVRSPKAKHLITNPINLKNLIRPSLDGMFFRYNGSLTTPGCQEAVIWTMFETPIGVSLRQLKSFQRLEEKTGAPLIDNFRPLQPLNGRKVLRKRQAAGIRPRRVSLFNNPTPAVRRP